MIELPETAMANQIANLMGPIHDSVAVPNAIQAALASLDSINVDILRSVAANAESQRSVVAATMAASMPSLRLAVDTAKMTEGLALAALAPLRPIVAAMQDTLNIQLKPIADSIALANLASLSKIAMPDLDTGALGMLQTLGKMNYGLSTSVKLPGLDSGALSMLQTLGKMNHGLPTLIQVPRGGLAGVPELDELDFATPEDLDDIESVETVVPESREVEQYERLDRIELALLEGFQMVRELATQRLAMSAASARQGDRDRIASDRDKHIDRGITITFGLIGITLGLIALLK